MDINVNVIIEYEFKGAVVAPPADYVANHM